MAKASLSLSAPALNRRRILGGATAAALGVTIPTAAPTASISPSPAGRRVLELIAEYIGLGSCDRHDDDPVFIAWEQKVRDTYGAIEEVGQEIVARPIKTFADVIDRAILAAWGCSPDDGQLKTDGDDPHGFQSALILGVLGVAGIRPSQCNIDMA
jgi:hypothetical protein